MYYKDILTKILGFVKLHFNDTMLFIIVALLIMLSFAIGFITAKYQTKTAISIEQTK
jgi:hypothetical protein